MLRYLDPTLHLHVYPFSSVYPHVHYFLLFISKNRLYRFISTFTIFPSLSPRSLLAIVYLQDKIMLKYLEPTFHLHVHYFPKFISTFTNYYCSSPRPGIGQIFSIQYTSPRSVNTRDVVTTDRLLALIYVLCSQISRQSIDACKDYFRDDLLKTDWQLMVELKKLFQIL
ncbi:Translation Initiation Factor 5B [Homalodisca vitripennis]|nr:Translation Initiation Factor 5B [Homalodisca vitripennis]KAG8335003.1 Translation Initiation Factor 5B [Homalodisca vitripennis]